MKKLLFVSTGRCGTKRVAQILRKYLPEEFSVVHQMPLSRFANLVGNLSFYLGSSEKIKHQLYHSIISKFSSGKHFICTDPLTAMIIPKAYVESEEVCIVHIERNAAKFAHSFFRLTRRRASSFIAHNFIPFWQIGIWPLENCLNPNIQKKYEKLSELKNKFFKEAYSSNPNFKAAEISQIFSSNFLNDIIYDYFHYEVAIPESELKMKAN